MQPLAFTTALANISRDERIGAARATRVPAPAARAAGSVTIRSAGADDAGALARLAQLDGRGETLGRDAVVAVVAGEVVAARDLRGGALSDPFRAGEELVALLEVRARQLAGGRFARPATRVPRQSMPVLRVGGAR
jgi:hypothetical protein